MDPLYGYEAVNVEAQAATLIPCSTGCAACSPSAASTRHSAAARLRFLYPENRKVLAYLREHEGETILCVANVSRVAAGGRARPVGVRRPGAGRDDGGSPFPPIGQLTYLLTLPPYGFYWFILTNESDAPSWHTPAPEPMPDYVTRRAAQSACEAS